MIQLRLLAATSLLALAAGTVASHADTLDQVRKTGMLRCGADEAREDYTRMDTHGDLSDLAIEVCKAVAVAVLGPGGKTDVHEWPDELHMMNALRDGGNDLAIGASPAKYDVPGFNVAFGPTVFSDGQSLLVARGIHAVADLGGKRICFVDDATLGENLESSMRGLGVHYLPFVFSELGEMLAAAGDGRCGAITGNLSQLINMSVGFAPIEKNFTLLPVMLTDDPVAPAFRTGDPRWAGVVGAVVDTLMRAEQLGVTAANVTGMTHSADPRIQALLAPRDGVGARDLPSGWAVTMLRSVGNYGEIFDRTLGAESDFNLPRHEGKAAATSTTGAAVRL